MMKQSKKPSKNLSTIVFCPRCFIDVEEDIGYLEWKHWKFCPDCGSELVQVPIEYRPEELKIYKERGLDITHLEYRVRMYEATKNPKWLEIRPGLYKDKKDIFEKLKELKEKEAEVKQNEETTT